MKKVWGISVELKSVDVNSDYQHFRGAVEIMKDFIKKANVLPEVLDIYPQGYDDLTIEVDEQYKEEAIKFAKYLDIVLDKASENYREVFDVEYNAQVLGLTDKETSEPLPGFNSIYSGK